MQDFPSLSGKLWRLSDRVLFTIKIIEDYCATHTSLSMVGRRARLCKMV